MAWVRSRRSSKKAGSFTPMTETFIPGFTPSLSRSDFGFSILWAHFSACGPSSKTAVPSGNAMWSSPSRDSTDRICLKGTARRKVPLKMSLSVSRSALPSESLSPKRAVQRASCPMSEYACDSVHHAYERIPRFCVPVLDNAEAVVAGGGDDHVSDYLAGEDSGEEDADGDARGAGGDAGDVEERGRREGHGEDSEEGPALDPALDALVDRAVLKHGATAEAGTVARELAQRFGEACDETYRDWGRYPQKRVEQAATSEDDTTARHRHYYGGRAQEDDAEEPGVTPALDVVLAQVKGDEETTKRKAEKKHAGEQEVLEADAAAAEVDEKPLALDLDGVVFVLGGLGWGGHSLRGILRMLEGVERVRRGRGSATKTLADGDNTRQTRGQAPLTLSSLLSPYGIASSSGRR